jgi:cytosine/adenosine deaminase-related metal-dependent hydrolase
VATADLLVHDAELIATVDDARREITGGWVAATGGVVSGLGGPGDPVPDAVRRVDARGCLVTPGLVNTHHHLYQNLTRAYAPALTGGLFDWLVTLYPLWARLDEEAAYVSAYVGLAELALSGCTTSTDHLYVHPRGAGDLISAEIAAARDLGVRFHPTRGSMSLSVKDGGLPILADSPASADSASLWLEARSAMLQGKLRHGAAAMSARDALEMATRGGAACLGRAGEIGQLSVGACGDLAVWPIDGVRFAGALSDPVEAWLRCGPVSARHTVVAGRLVVEDGAVVHPGLDEQLAVHRRVSARIQAPLT